MNDINLLPDIILYRNKRIATLSARTLIWIVIACILAVLLLLKTYERIDLQHKIDALNAEINQSSLKDLNAAQDRLTEKQAEHTEIKKLYSAVPTRSILVNKLLEKITGLMPPAVFADDIEYKGEGEELTLHITSDGREGMILFLKRLHNDPAFTDINISAITSSGQSYKLTVTVGVVQKQTESVK